MGMGDHSLTNIFISTKASTRAQISSTRDTLASLSSTLVESKIVEKNDTDSSIAFYIVTIQRHGVPSRRISYAPRTSQDEEGRKSRTDSAPRCQVQSAHKTLSPKIHHHGIHQLPSK
jgi:hypothetical protein